MCFPIMFFPVAGQASCHKSMGYPHIAISLATSATQQPAIGCSWWYCSRSVALQRSLFSSHLFPSLWGFLNFLQLANSSAWSLAAVAIVPGSKSMLLVCGTWWSSCAWLNLQNRFDDVRNHNCFCEEIARLCLHVLLSVGKMLEEKMEDRNPSIIQLLH